MAKAPHRASWAPADYEIADLAAVRALARGEADGRQQIRALKWIVETVCEVYEPSYRPDSQRDTDHAEGKRWVGLQIIKATVINTALLGKNDARTSTRDPERGPDTDEPEPRSGTRSVGKPAVKRSRSKRKPKS